MLTDDDNAWQVISYRIDQLEEVLEAEFKNLSEYRKKKIVTMLKANYYFYNQVISDYE
jgi:hypothetical protein